MPHVDGTAMFASYKVQWKKWDRDSIPNFSKSKRKIITRLSVDHSICNFSFIWYIGWSWYWVRGWLLSIHFCKAWSKLPSSKFCHTVHNAVRVHELLHCCESSRKCHHAAQTTPTSTNTILTCFYKMYTCAAIYGRIQMNNVPNESRLIMLSYTEISFVIFLFDFEKFGVKRGFRVFF